MAPKKGGGGFFGGGGGGGSGDGSSGFENSVWAEKHRFAGSHFKDPYARGFIVIAGIGVFALIAIMIWALSVKKTSDGSRKVFRWYRYGFSIAMTFM